ncbi:MAG: T9SS type A sorting domain-containing protein [Candidatus Eisenbacteria bacterium]|nr:T9SS type A sorting domain-containing protein [Candidatus Eisenbacteria bacterium]
MTTDAVLERPLLSRTLVLAAVALGLVAAVLFADARAQCILANPSFEVSGSGGQVFGGWEQFGSVGSTSFSSHGSVAARVTGPDQGGWDVSGVWQWHDASPGEQFEVTGHVAHSSSDPLTGGCRAIVNIEWWDASGMISYESHEVAFPSTQTDLYQPFSFVSGNAPSGTESIHALFAVLQSPDDSPPDVYYDQVTVLSESYPTIYDMQWNDFPGGRQISFSERDWRVKGPGYYGPGPNSFSNSESCVWVDDDDRLHMTVTNVGGTWYSTEVALVETLGYGDYIFTTVGRLDMLDPAVILGMFIWQYGPCYDDSYLWWNPYNEFDIEFGYWGNPSSDIGQFVAQPWDWYGNLESFDATFSEGEITSHAFRWLPDRVECRSWRGGPIDEAPENMIFTWTYTGPHIPRPEIPRVHINLWRCCDTPSSNQEVVIDAFSFFPAGQTGVDEDTDQDLAVAPGARLLAARPNPFNPVTTIGYSLRDGAATKIAVYNTAGRRVRTLVNGYVQAGDHEVTWDGRDESGAPVASGVYFYSLRAGDARETRRMVLVK